MVGKGQIYQIVLKSGEEYVAHPRYEAEHSLVTRTYTEETQQCGSIYNNSEPAITIPIEVFSTSAADTCYRLRKYTPRHQVLQSDEGIRYLEGPDKLCLHTSNLVKKDNMGRSGMS